MALLAMGPRSANLDLSMPEPQSALAHLPRSRPGSAPVTVAELRPAAIVQIAAWPDSLQAVKRILAEVLGQGVPPLGSLAAGAQGTIAALGPGRYLLVSASPDIVARLADVVAVADGAVTDLSHGRTILSLKGGSAAAILAKGLAIDLHPSVFPPGRVAQSVIHHIDVTVQCRAADHYELMVLRGFAEDFLEWLMDAGLEFGVAFIGPAA
jgi:heterotetrameric sarcosine oxidase gamma subunit